MVNPVFLDPTLLQFVAKLDPLHLEVLLYLFPIDQIGLDVAEGVDLVVSPQPRVPLQQTHCRLHQAIVGMFMVCSASLSSVRISHRQHFIIVIQILLYLEISLIGPLDQVNMKKVVDGKLLPFNTNVLKTLI